MAAVEILESPFVEEVVVARRLHLVAPEVAAPLSSGRRARSRREGVTLVARRRARQRARQRRRRLAAGLVLVSAIAVLAVPGHTFGATDGAGLSNDLAGSSVLASGMDYVVQPGDTVATIARAMNPVDPALARRLLVRELGSSVVVPGEHVLVP